MMLAHHDLRVVHVSTHVSLREACDRVKKERVLEVIEIANKACKDMGIENPRIAVAGLNPHCGENGMFGREEIEEIQPAIDQALAEGINIPEKKPTPPDTVFSKALGGWYDIVVAMYHDQGLAPFKSLSPDGVNFTAGLSAVRTSPDHGTAFDIAGKDKADPQSMRNAIYAAIDIAEHRRAWAEWTRNPLQRAERDRGGRDVSVKDLPQTEKEV